MPVFAYEGRDKQGNRIQGTVEATEERSAVRQLHEDGFYITSMRQQGAVGEARTAPPPSGILGVGARDLSVFFRDIHHMLHAGMTLFRAFELLSENSSNSVLRRIAASIAPDLSSGKPLSGELRKFPIVFSPLIIGLVTAGEAGGFLDRVCLQISQYLEKEEQLRNRLRRETFYPKAVVVVAVVVTALVPAAPSLVTGNYLPFLKNLFASVIRFAIPLGVIGGLWVAMKTRMGGPAVRRWGDEVKLMIPVVGSVVRKVALAKFCRALAALYSAGMGFGESLRLAADACGNESIAAFVRSRIPQVESGGRLSDVMRVSSHFPSMVIGMITTGEETGALDDTLNKVADYYEDEAETSTHQLTRVAGIAAFMLVAIMVLLQLISFYTGYFNDLLKATDEVT